MFDMEKIALIDGWFDPGEALFLYNRALESDGTAVELGSWKGRSTTAILQGIRDSRKANTLHVFDHFRGSPEHGKVNLYTEFCRNTAGLRKEVSTVIHNIDLNEFCSDPSNFTQPIYLLFIDTAHDAGSVGRDFGYFGPLVVSGGWVVFHDYYPGGEGWPDVRKFVDGLQSRPGYRFEGRPAGTTLGVFQRL